MELRILQTIQFKIPKITLYDEVIIKVKIIQCMVKKIFFKEKIWDILLEHTEFLSKLLICYVNICTLDYELLSLAILGFAL